MFLSRMGSRNQMDAKRNAGALPEAVARLASRAPDDIPADGRRRVSCSDNIVKFFKTLDPRCLEEIQIALVRDLFESRLFDDSRVFGRYHRIVINVNNVMLLVTATGRKRHPTEGQFNTEKNNGIGMEHVFCAEAKASKNIYSLMQIAFMLWTLFHHGLLKCVCAWARTWSQIAIAKSLLDGLRLLGGVDPGFRVGQIRFVT